MRCRRLAVRIERVQLPAKIGRTPFGREPMTELHASTVAWLGAERQAAAGRGCTLNEIAPHAV